MATTIKAASFANRVRSTATRLEIAYRVAKRLSEEWYALSMSSDVPFDSNPLEDGNATMPITNMDVYGLINRCDDLIADYEAGNKAKLNTVLKVAEPPGDWR
jgi:hypothetical protein